MKFISFGAENLGLPFEVGSLLDMLQVYAEYFVEMGGFFQWVGDQLKHHPELDKIIEDSSCKTMIEQLESTEESCRGLYLRESRIIVKESILKFKAQPPTLRQVAWETEIIKRSIMAGLSSKIFFLVLPHRSSYMFPKSLLSENTFNQFPSVQYDIREGGWCFATERFTASVHHLMRVAEYGLVSFAEFCGVKDKDRANWNKALQGIESAIRDPKHPSYIKGMTKSDEQYYTEAAAWLRNIKTAFRNPVAHIPKVYDEAKARDLFQAVRSLMDHLSIRFKEVPLPSGDEAV